MNDREIRAIRHLLHTSPASFFQFAFRALHPEEEYQHNWSIDLLGNALLKCYQGKTRRLIINMPPRSLKSTCTSIAFPAWILGVRPDTKIMCLTSQRNMLNEQHARCQELMSNPRYRSLFSHVRFNEKTNQIMTAHGGSRSGYLTSSCITGPAADMIIIDDPQSAMDTKDPTKCANLYAWCDRNIYQRLNNKHAGVVIVVTQRLSEEDLTGHLLKQDAWEVLSLPAIAIADEYLPKTLGGGLVRYKGEALHPVRENRDELREVLEKIGAKPFMSQYQQRPYPPNEGGPHYGYFHEAPHPDASREECKYAQGWFGVVEEETFLLDKIFGVRTCIRPGGPPALTMAEWYAMEDLELIQKKLHGPIKKEIVLPNDKPTQPPAPDRTNQFGVRCEPCTMQDIEAAAKRSNKSWR
ncbi:MAG: hypothetical protein JKY96_00290 [Phycisphaerales bacterium]|nr:hypothetical protein [Phycisphaerales bacterium]